MEYFVQNDASWHHSWHVQFNSSKSERAKKRAQEGDSERSQVAGDEERKSKRQ
jgi:hypothetical protein